MLPYLVFHGPGADVDVEVNTSGVQEKRGLPASQGLDDLAKHDLDAWAAGSSTIGSMLRFDERLPVGISWESTAHGQCMGIPRPSHGQSRGILWALDG